MSASMMPIAGRVWHRAGEIDGDGGFAHAAFAAADGDDVFHAGDLRTGRGGAATGHRHLALLRRLLRGHLNVYAANALVSLQRGFHLALNLLWDGRVAGHDVQGDGDIVRVRDDDRADDAEADDVAAESRGT